jgi:phosphoserine phosphatase
LDLVVQGPGLTRQLEGEASRLLQKSDVLKAGGKAIRFRSVPRNDSIDAWCEKHRLDYAWLEDRRPFTDLKLVAMDMDSTLITIECIDEMGDLAGKKAEIAGITAQAMRGEIEYPESLRRRVALLAGLEESALERIYAERLKYSPGARHLLAACKANNVKLLLVSGGFTFFVDRLKDRLEFDYAGSNVLEMSGGKLTGRLIGDIFDAEAKARKFRETAKTLKAEKHQTVAIGDGANDLKMMAEAGLSVAYRAKPVVRAQATCALNHSGLDGVLNLFL